MTIGEALKQERQKLGMSKYEFSKGIIDRKFYGKVEDEGRNLGSKALAKLLFQHHINIDNFFDKIKDNYAAEIDVLTWEIDQQMAIAIKNKDLNLMKKCLRETKHVPDARALQLRIKVFIAYLENNIKAASPILQPQIEHELGKYDDISKNAEVIKLFSNSIPILKDEQVNYFMKIILTKINKRNLSDFEKMRFAQLCNNYLKTCIDRGIRSSVIKQAMEFLNSLNDPQLLIYKMLGFRDYSYLQGRKSESKEITEVLRQFGYKM